MWFTWLSRIQNARVDSDCWSCNLLTPHRQVALTILFATGAFGLVQGFLL